jgi:hypothetical protein
VLRGADPERDGVSSRTGKNLCPLAEARFGVVPQLVVWLGHRDAACATPASR